MRDDIRNPMHWTDGYKFCHPGQYPEGTELIYETWTPRKSKHEDMTHAVFFGLQGALQEITESFDKEFFSRPLEAVVEEFKEVQHDVFAATNPRFANNPDTSRVEALHKLGYLPIKVKGLKEGTFTPIGGRDGQTPQQRKGVPMFTIENTRPEEFWLPGHLETPLSAMIWLPQSVATVADKCQRILRSYAEETGDPSKVINQVGEFSMRGSASPEAALRIAGGHLSSFTGSATIAASKYLKEYYGASDDTIKYTPSSEHSVACAYGEESELDFLLRLATEVYPDGNFSTVADTYDFWNFIDEVLPQAKDVIMARNGKVLIRPDSGDPVKVICGDPDSKDESVRKGLIQRLSEIFGATKNNKGYLELSPQIGAIYGDGITTEVMEEVCRQLKDKGFATTNINYGIGSQAYQLNTRDTFGFALKATAAIINSDFKMLQKKPKTEGTFNKTSQKGMVAVIQGEHDLELVDELTPEQEANYEGNMFETIYENGKLTRFQTFDEIREIVAAESRRVYGDKEVSQ